MLVWTVSRAFVYLFVGMVISCPCVLTSCRPLMPSSALARSCIMLSIDVLLELTLDGITRLCRALKV